VRDTVLTGSNAEDDAKDSAIGDRCVRLIKDEVFSSPDQ
jgi:hypothetical protein